MAFENSRVNFVQFLTEDEIIDFWLKVRLEGECLVWQGNRDQNGYGRMYFGKILHTLIAHRVSYELLVGVIPQGKVLDHLCRNPPCINPRHLEPVSVAENILRGEGLAAINYRKTHCKKGHEFTPENTYVPPSKYKIGRSARHCRICHNLRVSMWNKQRRGRPAVGSQSHLAKVDEAAVVLIRQRRLAGEPLRSIGQDYGLSDAGVSMICNRHHWKHVL